VLAVTTRIDMLKTVRCILFQNIPTGHTDILRHISNAWEV
jgi:hypothetical protein